MALASVTYTGNGTTGPWSFPKPYIAREHVHVYVDEVEVDFTFLTSSTLSISPAPANGTQIKISRETPNDVPLVDWSNTANITEENLNLQTLQNLYVMQEGIDLAAATSTAGAAGSAALASEKANVATAQAVIATDNAEQTTEDRAVTTAASSTAVTAADTATQALSAMLGVGRMHQVGDIKFQSLAYTSPGWMRIKRDPQAVLKTAAPELNAKYAAEGYPYGSTSTHFNIPGGAGLFVRPWDDTSTHDPDAASRLAHDGTPGAGNVIGSRQASENKQHAHGITQNPHSHQYNPYDSSSASVGAGAHATIAYGSILRNTVGANADITINNEGGNESRPANVAFPFVILVNPGEAGNAHTPFGLPYSWDTGTSDADPGTGELRLNHATPASATFLYVSKTGANAATLTSVWNLINGITATTRAVLTIMHGGAPSNAVVAGVTGAVVDATGYLKVPVTVLSVGGAFPAGVPLSVQIGLAGGVGPVSTEPGPQGEKGWSAVEAIENDGARRVKKIVDWQGGQGTKPAVNLYVGASGLEALIANGVDIRGAAGAGNGDVVGPGTSAAHRLAAFTDTTGALLEDSGVSVSADGTLAGDSDALVATQKATKTYVDTVIAALRAGVSASFDTLAEIATAIGGLVALAGGQTLTGGLAGTSFAMNSGSPVTTGTLTPVMTNSNLQHYTNGGAHTLAPPSAAGSIVIDMTNNGSAGAVTTSGFTKVSGDGLTTTNGHKFRLFITVGNAGSHLHKQAMQ
ncbi:phage tail fiber domain-containing protein [Hyphomicrobium album]|uniref:phage tail fiber domain-containing protein n=1 Tax=Hyphomicrobium album TaxID=2665159 RepID=UPI0018A93CDE|nr:phage tail fiber protein [Hyphomicrobium album]